MMSHFFDDALPSQLHDLVEKAKEQVLRDTNQNLESIPKHVRLSD